MNEELRSSGEELETSKEELQALNEELRTVNQELKLKIEEQAQANDDIQNLVNSTEIGTIFLDRAACIKLFTPPARAVFTLIAADRGRPLSDISSALVDADLHADIERVLERLGRVEREVQTREGRWHLLRMLPYRTANDRIDGVVLTFLDITERKQAQERLLGSERYLRLLIESVTEYAIFAMDPAGRIVTWNAGAARTYGYSEEEAIGLPGAMLFTPDDRERGIPDAELRRAAQDGRAADERWHIRKDGSRFFASGVITPLRDANGSIEGYVKVARELTERKQWEDALQQAHADLELGVQQRTRELAEANAALDARLAEQRQVEEQSRALIRRLITIQEDERRRIARDLHDHVGQQVAGLSLKIDALAERLRGTIDVPDALEDVRQTIARLDRDLDFFTWKLRPAALEDLGLVATLGNFVREWSKEFGIAAEFHSRGLDSIRLAYELEINLYRIAQEALNNIFKHARADRVGVILERRADRMLLVIEDDGDGFDRTVQSSALERGIGLLGMEERAALIGGTLEVETTPGNGTTVFVQVPMVSN